MDTDNDEHKHAIVNCYKDKHAGYDKHVYNNKYMDVFKDGNCNVDADKHTFAYIYDDGDNFVEPHRNEDGNINVDTDSNEDKHAVVNGYEDKYAVVNVHGQPDNDNIADSFCVAYDNANLDRHAAYVDKYSDRNAVLYDYLDTYADRN